MGKKGFIMSTVGQIARSCNFLNYLPRFSSVGGALGIGGLTALAARQWAIPFLSLPFAGLMVASQLAPPLIGTAIGEVKSYCRFVALKRRFFEGVVREAPQRWERGQTSLEIDLENFYALLGKVPRDDQNHLMEQALRIISSNECMYVRLQVLEDLSQLGKTKRENVVAQALRLIPQDRQDLNKGSLISTLSKISPEDRAEVVTDALSLSASERHACDAVLIIRGITHVWVKACEEHLSQSQRKETIQQALQLITPQMSNRSRVRVFTEIYRRPADQRQAIISHACLLPHLVEGDEEGIPELIEALSTIPSKEREERMRAALSLGALKGSVSPRFLRLSTLATLEERPRATTNGSLLTLEEKATYRDTMCIFEAERDERTRAAIGLLQQSQGDLNSESISQAVKEFKSYLKKAQISDEDKGKAQQALCPLPYELAHYTFHGMRSISWEELIARLWIFSKGHREKDACQHGMIRALVCSIKESGFRILLRGQVQLQVIAVLQGRLKDVNIDDIPLTIDDPLSALTGQGHTTRAALFKDAEKVLNAHPALDSSTFLSELSRFAYREGLS